jgi:hypothetical protein
MAGGLIQVVSYGNQDLMLTGNPEITFFNIIYRRYTNFGKKIIELGFDNTVDFGQTSILTIPKNSGDLLSKLILKIKLPRLSFENLNKEISINPNVALTDISNNSTYILYYDFFIDFYNNLLNTVNIFFNQLGIQNTSTYIKDLSEFIQAKINNDKYEQFYTSVSFYFNNGLVSEKNFVNIDIFTNASLFKKVNDNFIYIYENFSENEVTFEQFKFAVYKNMSILQELNGVLYTKLKNYFINRNILKVAWIKKIAIYLFDSIEFYIGSNKIVKLSDLYINTYGELWYKNPEVYNEMIGNESEINLFSITKDETYLYLPIPFWFLNNYGLAFPLVALQFNTVQVRISTKSFIDCIKVNSNVNNFDSKIEAKIIDYILNSEKDIIRTPLEISMLAEYVYLDGVERKKFAQSAHEYLITQVQELEFDNLTVNNNSFTLDFFHCCKDIYWQVVKNKDYRDLFNNFIDSRTYSLLAERININTFSNEIIFKNYINTVYRPQYYFNPNDFILGRALLNSEVFINEFIKYFGEYVLDTYNRYYRYKPLLNSSNLYLNGTVLIGEQSNFFNFAIPYKYYNSTPEIGIYSYSFCLNPTETQPSGSINLSRIPSFHIKVKFNEEVIKFITENNFLSNNVSNISNKTKNSVSDIKFKLVVQVNNFNVLRLIGGIGATAYSY